MHAVVEGEAFPVARLVRTQLGHDVFHGLSMEVLHHEVDLAVLIAPNVVNRHDARMLELSNDPHLVRKTHQGRGGCTLSEYPLYGDRSTNVVVSRELDLSHGSLAELAHSLESSALLDDGTVLGFADTLRRGRTVVRAADVPPCRVEPANNAASGAPKLPSEVHDTGGRRIRFCAKRRGDERRTEGHAVWQRPTHQRGLQGCKRRRHIVGWHRGSNITQVGGRSRCPEQDAVSRAGLCHFPVFV